jgi:ketosteroid isomerase-like protein
VAEPGLAGIFACLSLFMERGMKRTMAVMAAVVLLAACQGAETDDQANARMQTEADSARAAIDAHTQNYARWMVGGNADSIASLYTDNAAWMPPNMATVTGAAAIRDSLTGIFRVWRPATVQFRVVSIAANGPVAVVRGSYAMTGADGSADSGKYMEHWHRVNGQWKIAEEIWNTDTPMAPPPPAPRRRSS